MAPEQNFLDITAYVCPLTFVRARLALERIGRGEQLVIRLNAGEPLENLPRSLTELGFRVVSLVPDTSAAHSGTHRLTVAKD
jgi:TusA-related sulfurtransferase